MSVDRRENPPSLPLLWGVLALIVVATVIGLLTTLDVEGDVTEAYYSEAHCNEAYPSGQSGGPNDNGNQPGDQNEISGDPERLPGADQAPASGGEALRMQCLGNTVSYNAFQLTFISVIVTILAVSIAAISVIATVLGWSTRQRKGDRLPIERIARRANLKVHPPVGADITISNVGEGSARIIGCMINRVIDPICQARPKAKPRRFRRVDVFLLPGAETLMSGCLDTACEFVCVTVRFVDGYGDSRNYWSVFRLNEGQYVQYAHGE
jgi:hypothetical protein